MLRFRLVTLASFLTFLLMRKISQHSTPQKKHSNEISIDQSAVSTVDISTVHSARMEANIHRKKKNSICSREEVEVIRSNRNQTFDLFVVPHGPRTKNFLGLLLRTFRGAFRGAIDGSLACILQCRDTIPSPSTEPAPQKRGQQDLLCHGTQVAIEQTKVSPLHQMDTTGTFHVNRTRKRTLRRKTHSSAILVKIRLQIVLVLVC